MQKYKNIISILSLSFSTFLAWIVGYLYYPIMMRQLTLSQFSELASLLWLINILLVLGAPLWLFFVKEYTKTQDDSKKYALIEYIKQLWVVVGIVTFMLYIFISPYISHFLKIENIFLVIFIWVMLFLNFIVLYQWTFLQSNKYFNVISITNILNPILRLSLWFIFVLFWYWVFGAIWWVVGAQIIIVTILYFFIKNKNSFFPNNKNISCIKDNIKKDFKKQKAQILHFFISSFILALLMNIDILFAKHFFESESAWIYAWISIIAKFLVFIGMSIETVYYPVITSAKHLDKKKILLLSILYIIITLSAIWFFYLFWERILHLFKPWFEKHLNLLYFIIIYCWGLALLNFLVKILIAFHKYMINYIVFISLIIFIFFLYRFVGDSMYNLIYIFNACILALILSSFLCLWIGKSRK